MGQPTALFRAGVSAQDAVVQYQYVVSPDGQQFLIDIPTEEGELSAITIVLNWNPETDSE